MRKTSGGRRAIHVVIMGIVVLITLEIVVRVFFAFQVGPSVLLYGTPMHRRQLTPGEDVEATAYFHENQAAGYSKFYPNQTRYDFDTTTGERIPVGINSHGFRGREFTTEKAPGVVRIVTLGASSTFGYHDRDDETYPFQIEKLLNEQCHDARIEVINLGIPHLTSDQILALFLAEALPLDPDVVTFYEGVNDSYRGGGKQAPAPGPPDSKLARIRRIPVVRKAFVAVRRRLLLVHFLHAAIQNRALTEDTFSKAALEEHIRGTSEIFLANLDRIRAEAEKAGIVFVVASQQAKSLRYNQQTIRGTTYAEEVETLKQAMRDDGSVKVSEGYLLTHSVVMQDLKRWALTNHVPFVDAIAATDQHRDTLLSWVHLNAEGNRLVAEAFAQEIGELICP